MTIVLTGAGSGGHITPLLALAAELKRIQPHARLVYVGQRGDNLGDIPAEDPNIDEVRTVRAGKFRRYHEEGLRQLLDLPTLLKNSRDFFYVLIGLVQSWLLLGRLQPDVIFIKGGFVGVPIGLAAAARRLPYITHDSDAIPGLANRIIAPWARLHAVALPKEVYQYPPDKTVTTGIPLQAGFVPVTTALQQRYRRELQLPATAKVLFVIGGGLGAQRINHAVSEIVPHLLQQFRDLYVIHQTGRANEQVMRAVYDQLPAAEQGRLQAFGYAADIFRYSGAADLIVTRAGATNLAEFAVQGKACVVIPAPHLTGGQQVKNARYLSEQQAAVILPETDLAADSNRLAKEVSALLGDDGRRRKLGQNLAGFAKPGATADLAKLILKTAEGQGA